MRKQAKSQKRMAYVKRGASSRNSYSFLAWSKRTAMRRCRRIIKDPVFPGEKKKSLGHQD